MSGKAKKCVKFIYLTHKTASLKIQLKQINFGFQYHVWTSYEETLNEIADQKSWELDPYA